MGISVQSISKSFGSFHAVDDVSLEIKMGSLVALLGPSGSGKLTSLRMIAGLERPDQGEIWLTSENATDRSVQDRSIGFVFQHHALFKDFKQLELERYQTVFVKPKKLKPFLALAMP
ncbi:ATP-binding cassette domain-containing protein [Phormidium sp. FACHB-592]|uniref:ATP-binding cassette domain-containing protein n=1 Tax=Phormidium sp. FACHB-592 TaxID=2692850 RepID=UPI001685BE4B|nr:ATP-binding cassette domain-containing protein [Phormidium sp. FACHB-592]